jgi:uncharacterized paraquat-inducible protein A
MARKLPPQRVVCTECHEQFEAVPKLNFWGLFKFSCPRCGATVLYPMSGRRRSIYRVVAASFGILCVAALAFGRIVLPGILPVGLAVGLVMDAKARKRVREAESHRNYGWVSSEQGGFTG